MHIFAARVLKGRTQESVCSGLCRTGSGYEDSPQVPFSASDLSPLLGPLRPVPPLGAPAASPLCSSQGAAPTAVWPCGRLLEESSVLYHLLPLQASCQLLTLEVAHPGQREKLRHSWQMDGKLAGD